jgi:hypothetical protein
VYAQLKVWTDRNHDGMSQPEELSTLSALGIERLDTDFKLSRHVDEHGNSFRLRAPSYWRDDRGRIRKRMFYDVWLVIR